MACHRPLVGGEPCRYFLSPNSFILSMAGCALHQKMQSIFQQTCTKRCLLNWLSRAVRKCWLRTDRATRSLLTPPPLTEDETGLLERHWRDAELNAVTWLRDRHRDELELGRHTSLPAERYEHLLHYLQALREWPQAKGFPSPAHRPAPQPWLLAVITRNQPL